MKKIKIIAGITWAFIFLVLMLAFFPGYTSLSRSFAKLPFMKINPNISGGDVAKSLITDCCTLDIRRPVFDGLLGERQKGFVQIDWRGEIPDQISDTIDYNFDNINDFAIIIERKSAETELEVYSEKVEGVDVSTSTSYGWAARINLKK